MSWRSWSLSEYISRPIGTFLGAAAGRRGARVKVARAPADRLRTVRRDGARLFMNATPARAEREDDSLRSSEVPRRHGHTPRRRWGSAGDGGQIAPALPAS